MLREPPFMSGENMPIHSHPRSGVLRRTPLVRLPGLLPGLILLLSPAPPIASARAQALTELRGPYLGQTPPGDEPVLFAPDLLYCPHGYHSAVVFSPDGTEACWTQMTPGELMMHSYQVDGVWTLPQTTHLHTFADITEPFFHPDGSRIFFLCDSPTEIDPEDRELPEPINSASNDLCPVITPDGEYLFFTSSRSGEWQIYWVRAGFLDRP